MKGTKQIYLYDARFNLKTPITYNELESIGIVNYNMASSYKSKRSKLKKINKYIVDEDTPIKELKELYLKEQYEDEIWREILDCDTPYFVSNYGRVKKKLKTKEMFLLPFRSKSKNTLYNYIKLKINGKYKEVRISSLVANYFLTKPQDGKEYRVKHLNGVKYDDWASNLEFISLEELGKVTGGMSKAQSILQVNPYDYEIIDSFKSAREAAKIIYSNRQSVTDIANLNACYSMNGEVFVKEEDYYDFVDTLETKKYMCYNAKTKEVFKGTLLDIREKYNMDIHKLRYSYFNKTNVLYTNMYITSPNKRNLDEFKIIYGVN